MRAAFVSQEKRSSLWDTVIMGSVIEYPWLHKQEPHCALHWLDENHGKWGPNLFTLFSRKAFRIKMNLRNTKPCPLLGWCVKKNKQISVIFRHFPFFFFLQAHKSWHIGNKVDTSAPQHGSPSSTRHFQGLRYFLGDALPGVELWFNLVMFKQLPTDFSLGKNIWCRRKPLVRGPPTKHRKTWHSTSIISSVSDSSKTTSR